ncbi:PepSY-associated TM helix domain-containing protein [Marinicauda sp. Alg238-R41]|uniref:PepSY-associated TM helix domain-containing protein n=1 Tax=Marinicauda sp. Alg238-R41 TaxID=2993447 RepID=UPI0022DFDEF4|nr:PepSY-associated TM helix domain-containing protein [Marinicauda sp. Alg238-R41]
MARWPSVSKKFVAQILSAHAGLGVVAGAVLFILSLSGVLVVFHEDFARWEQPGAPEMREYTPEAASLGMDNAIARYQSIHDGALPDSAYMVLPTRAAPRMTALLGDDAWFIAPDGALAGEVDHAYSEFLIEQHYYLNLPHTPGIILVGIFGAIMLALVISGFAAHPRVFRDAFRFRRSGNPQLAEADLHNRLSVWGSPFHVIIPLTGAMLGLSILFAVVVGQSFHEGDMRYAFQPTFGAEGVRSDAEAPVADIAPALHTMRERRPDVEPWFLDLEYPGTESQSVKILSRLPRRLIFGEYYQFDAAGEYQGQVGLENGTVGQQIIAGAYQLHFGSFGGLPVKIAYALLGLALCMIVASGVNLWLMKRAARAKASPRLERAWISVIWGSPALLALCFIAVSGGASDVWLAPIFWVGLASVAILSTFVRSRAILSAGLKLASAAFIALGVLWHAIASGAPASPAFWGVSAWLLLTAIALSVAGAFGFARAGRASREPAPGTPDPVSSQA